MTGFIYTYTSSNTIFNNLTHIGQYSWIQFLILFIGILCICSIIFFFLPKFDIRLNEKRQAAEKKKKRQLMNKIILQKNLEDIISRELEQNKIST